MRVPTNGTDTSNAAADSMIDHVGRLQGEVIDQIRQRHLHGATCDEIEVALGLAHQTVSPRVYELHKKGLIVDSGLRRKTRSGRGAKVWVTAKVAGTSVLAEARARHQANMKARIDAIAPLFDRFPEDMVPTPHGEGDD
jgi:hypothetical protein